MSDKEKAPENAKEAPQDEKLTDEPEVVRFPPEEEAADANALFASKDYQNALSRYDDAIASCPNYLHYERAVIQSNISACHLQIEQWTEAIKAATDAIDSLAKVETEEQLVPKDEPKDTESDSKDEKTNDNKDEDDVEEEIVSSGAERAAPMPPPEPTPEQAALENRRADILRIRTKALLRRARARSEAGGWSNLAGAEEDYRTLSQMPGLTPADQRTVRSQLKALPPRTKAAQEAEMSEMWGKLRGLGDSLLKPFGLSTNNFQMVKDEKTGGYSMNFSQGGSSS
ncbi:hypothetical protein M441DRAFT_135420 [Trichoderma asperellum CBS 433.97]|uniref:Tetratricopeptide repeat protein 1 (TTC1) n=1 Tax=Trichoderma asperellum (strain ATCC 204424 / CBS 433.97 / NBRC 101777) TaxID=1042311 RepID=A0A2T3ZFE4_TRIA4|nr:hypothetical protein M441DRAFT_135420 [Trichoderma asperellum CBS 433.97]PTB43509.1 hypothetical protein M441DRAFT_135420 [Trichoderma asperellum CBS 433.97]